MNHLMALRASSGERKLAADPARTDRLRLAQGLARLLAGSHSLCLKIQGFQWNLAGPLPGDLHKLADAQRQDLIDGTNRIALQISALGFPVPASLRRFGALSEIDDESELGSARSAMRQLAADHETLIRTLRDLLEIAERNGEDVAAALLIERLASHARAARTLRSLRGSPS